MLEFLMRGPDENAVPEKIRPRNPAELVSYACAACNAAISRATVRLNRRRSRCMHTPVAV
jgi:hypothetical protein